MKTSNHEASKTGNGLAQGNEYLIKRVEKSESLICRITVDFSWKLTMNEIFNLVYVLRDCCFTVWLLDNNGNLFFFKSLFS